jgi:hypothetical protein
VAVAFRYLERDGNNCVPDLGWEAVDSDTTFGKVEEEPTPGGVVTEKNSVRWKAQVDWCAADEFEVDGWKYAVQ